MTLSASEATRIVDKFNGGNYNLQKFKNKLFLTSMDLWNIVDRYGDASPSNVDFKVLKNYKRRVNKILCTSRIANNQERRGRYFAIFMKQNKLNPTSFLFINV